MTLQMMSVMSHTFTISGYSSVLSADFYPPIELDSTANYGLGLLGFYSYNSIFNVDEKNNQFSYKTSSRADPILHCLPPGAYEIDEIHTAMLRALKSDKSRVGGQEDDEELFSLRANNNTLKCEIQSKYEIDFTQEKSIGRLLGFEAVRLQPNKMHQSTQPIDIMKVRIIRVDCNIIYGAYLNGEKAHTLFEFDIDVEPGYKLSKEPQNIIYMPVRLAAHQFIDNITLRILDDSGDLINFQGEKIIVKLELKKLL